MANGRTKELATRSTSNDTDINLVSHCIDDTILLCFIFFVRCRRSIAHLFGICNVNVDSMQIRCHSFFARSLTFDNELSKADSQRADGKAIFFSRTRTALLIALKLLMKPEFGEVVISLRKSISANASEKYALLWAKVFGPHTHNNDVPNEVA